MGYSTRVVEETFVGLIAKRGLKAALCYLPAISGMDLGRLVVAGTNDLNSV